MRLLRFVVVAAAVIGAFVSASAKPADAGDDLTAPVCTIESASNYGTMYPRIDGYRDTFQMSFSATDENLEPITVQLLVLIPGEPAIEVFAGPEFQVTSGSGDTLTWNGKDDEGVLVPEELYAFTIKTTDQFGNFSVCQIGVEVDHGKITRTTFTQKASAAESELDRLVGRCSLLRNPSLRDWQGSLGYYSNKKCEDGFNPSRVATANGILVPRAYQNKYHSLQIKAYGGAAKGHAGDEAALFYLKKDIDHDPVLLRWMGSKVGTHAGAKVTKKVGSFIRREEEGEKRPYVAWQVIAVNGLQYDIKNFTVIIEYTGLIDPNDNPRIAHATRPVTGSAKVIFGR